MSERAREMGVAPPPTPPTSSIIRPTLALLAGLGITALVVGLGVTIATLAMLRGVDPKTFQPSSANLLVYLAINAAGAFAGGWTVARITAGRSFYTVFLLALILFMSASVVLFRAGEASGQPRWYLASLAAAVLLFSLLGGYVERRRQRLAAEG
jgi:heme A synthase